MDFTTPKYHHVSRYKDVYEPAEDTFLLLDALEKDHSKLKALNASVVLEVGCGSGVVSTFAATLIGPDTLYISTDINPSASACCNETGKINCVILNPITTCLTDGFLPRLENKVDLLIFNPPYVITPSDEIMHGGLSAAWAGGFKGREVMDKFFPLVSKLLSDNGLFYLVVIKENDPQDIANLFAKYSFNTKTVMSRRAGPEHLSILRISRHIVDL